MIQLLVVCGVVFFGVSFLDDIPYILKAVAANGRWSLVFQARPPFVDFCSWNRPPKKTESAMMSFWDPTIEWTAREDLLIS